MTRIGLYGYGNIGKSVELAAEKADDMKLVAVFTRRNPDSVKTYTSVPVYPREKALDMKDDIDVMIMCGGSATDLPVDTPELARSFCVIDTFDTHHNIPSHFDKVDGALKAAGKTGLISIGWDPGLFSLNRLLSNAILPDGRDYTFWGKGVSQGHSDAVRRIKGVKNAKQYTIPREQALAAVRAGENPELTPRDMHLRECFVVPEEGASLADIEREIVTMPNYFDEYDTVVHFISEEEFLRDHSAIPHGGFVIRSGHTGAKNENNHIIEYSLKLDSNPDFTAGVIICYSRAVARLYREGSYGCKTVFDIAPSYLLDMTDEDIRRKML